MAVTEDEPGESQSAEHRLLLIGALAALYVIWGSTYLAMRYAIDTIPPFLMAGTRFTLAGTLLCSWARHRQASWPTMPQWRTAGVVGVALMLGGNGCVVWAEQRVPSSMAAVVVAIGPLCAVVLDWLRPGGRRPGGLMMFGLLTGFVGVFILVNPGGTAQPSGRPDPIGLAALLIAVVSWAGGSIYSRVHRGAPSPLMAAGANMLVGGLALLLLGLLTGEGFRLHLAAVSLRSALAVLYLVVFGSLVGFTSYTWLLRNTSAAQATSYAYVNPVVAIILGWAIGGETLSPRSLLAAMVILIGVLTITVLPHLRSWLVARLAGRVKVT